MDNRYDPNFDDSAHEYLTWNPDKTIDQYVDAIMYWYYEDVTDDDLRRIIRERIMSQALENLEDWQD